MSTTSMATKTDFLDLANDYLRQVYAELKNNNVNLPLLMLVSATTRVLAYNKGMGEVFPHVWLQGRPQIGKNYIITQALRLLPDIAVEHHSGGESPKFFTRERSDIQHKLVVFEEADSLAAGPTRPLGLAQGHDNSRMASSFRTALDSGDFDYRTLDRGNRPEEFHREGPFVLWSTSTQIPEGQLGSRMCVIALPEPDARAKAERNLVQAELKKNGWPKVSQELLVQQSDWQKSAPINIGISDEASEVINRLASMGYESRTFSQIQFMLQGLALLAQRDKVLAVDYDTLYDLNKTSEFLTAGINGGDTGNLLRVAQAIVRIRVGEMDAAERRYRLSRPKMIKNPEFEDLIPGDRRLLDPSYAIPDEMIPNVEPSWEDIDSVRELCTHARITSPMLADEMKLKKSQADELIKQAEQAGWIENIGRSRYQPSWQLADAYRPTLAGLPSREDLMAPPVEL